jgi:hypothetical protein
MGLSFLRQEAQASRGGKPDHNLDTVDEEDSGGRKEQETRRRLVPVVAVLDATRHM